MYLEISPRQCGKTSRLIKDITSKYSIYESCNVVVYCMNDMAADLLKRKFDKVGFHYVEIRPLVSNKRRRLDVEITPDIETVYFDEFDFMDIEELWKLFYIIESYGIDSYWCTTPRRIRTMEELFSVGETDDILKVLLHKNNLKYYKHGELNPKLLHCRHALTKKQYKTEILGNFIK